MILQNMKSKKPSKVSNTDWHTVSLGQKKLISQLSHTLTEVLELLTKPELPNIYRAKLLLREAQRITGE